MNPTISRVNPYSFAISSVSSGGKPYVSDSANASLPVMVEALLLNSAKLYFPIASERAVMI